MSELNFSIKLKQVPVKLDDKQYFVKELTGEQRDIYDQQFDLQMEMVDGIAKPKVGENFKRMSSSEFLALCLYNDKDELVPIGTIAKFPNRVVEKLVAKGRELSSLTEESIIAVKNELEASDDSGTS